jgi:hypothetical protein
MVASWSAYVFSSHLKRNARASMVIGNGLDFPAKWSLYGQVTYIGVVDIHQHVLKSTTGET